MDSYVLVVENFFGEKSVECVMQKIWNILWQHSPFALIKEILEKDTSAW